MIVLDVEATDLMQPEAAGLARQPHIIEVTMLVLDDDTLDELDVSTSLVKPPVPIPPKITRITKITDAMVANAPTFPALARDLMELLLAERTVVAHNLAYDLAVLGVEFARMGCDVETLLPGRRVCTVEHTTHLGLKDRKLTTLYEHLLGKPLAQTHRSEDDVRALAEVVRKLRDEGIL